MSAPPITLPAVFTPHDDAEPGSGLGHLSAWCPHCERLHYHGAAGRGAEPRIEMRGAHCEHAAGSPAAGRSYRLAVEAVAMTPTAPSAPMHQMGHRLRTTLRDQEMELRRALFLALIGPGAEAIHYAPGDIVCATIGPMDLLTAEYGRSWQTQASEEITEGRGLLGLLAQLFAISPGIAGRRILEAMTGAQFPADGALEIEAVLDRWAAVSEGCR